jgi:hypothetical protein
LLLLLLLLWVWWFSFFSFSLFLFLSFFFLSFPLPFPFSLFFFLPPFLIQANNFDSEFTDADPTLTPTDPTVVKGIDQDLFNGFSFVNPNFGKFRAADGPAAAAVESTQQLATPVPLERSSSAASIQVRPKKRK